MLVDDTGATGASDISSDIVRYQHYTKNTKNANNIETEYQTLSAPISSGCLRIAVLRYCAGVFVNHCELPVSRQNHSVRFYLCPVICFSKTEQARSAREELRNQNPSRAQTSLKQVPNCIEPVTRSMLTTELFGTDRIWYPVSILFGARLKMRVAGFSEPAVSGSIGGPFPGQQPTLTAMYQSCSLSSFCTHTLCACLRPACP